MHKTLCLLFFSLFILNATYCHAECSKISRKSRQTYASNLYAAFVAQCQGRSTAAMCQFQTAYEDAIKAGEHVHRLKVIEQLFTWYRTYGSACQLFGRIPQGHDRIQGEWRKPLSTPTHIDYQSEWGNTPEQAALIREFFLGIAETISGIFCVTVGSGALLAPGVTLCIDGPRRMFLSLNNLWADHEQALIDFKNWEGSARKFINTKSKWDEN